MKNYLYFIFMVLALIGLPQIIKLEGNMNQKTYPEFLYKIVSQEDWEKSTLQGQVVRSSVDTDFIHLAKEDQIPQVVEKFWKCKDHIVLKLDSKQLIGRLVYETNPGRSTKYYHLYEGTIPLNAVVDVTLIQNNS